jgi:hypothetical protein
MLSAKPLRNIQAYIPKGKYVSLECEHPAFVADIEVCRTGYSFSSPESPPCGLNSCQLRASLCIFLAFFCKGKIFLVLIEQEERLYQSLEAC